MDIRKEAIRINTSPRTFFSSHLNKYEMHCFALVRDNNFQSIDEQNLVFSQTLLEKKDADQVSLIQHVRKHNNPELKKYIFNQIRNTLRLETISKPIQRNILYKLTIELDYPNLWFTNAISCENIEGICMDNIHGKPSVLMYAVLNNAIDTVKLLLSFRPDITESPLLHMAASNGNLHMAVLLLSYGADVDTPHGDGETPLIWAIHSGALEIVKHFVGIGANVNIPDYSGRTPLDWAAYYGHKDIFCFLMDHKASITNHTFDNALSPPNGCDILDIIFPLYPGEIVNTPTKYGEMPLQIVARLGNLAVCQWLIERDHSDDFIKTAQSSLEIAAKNDHLEIVRLLSQYVDLDNGNSDGENALFIAANYGYTSMVKWLCTKIQNINSTNKVMQTPLSLSLENNHLDTAEALILSGALIDPSALPRAVYKGNTETVHFLVKHGANIHFSIDGVNLFHYVNNNHIPIIKILVEYDVDASLIDTEYKTPPTNIDIQVREILALLKCCALSNPMVMHIDTLDQNTFINAFEKSLTKTLVGINAYVKPWLKIMKNSSQFENLFLLCIIFKDKYCSQELEPIAKAAGFNNSQSVKSYLDDIMSDCFQNDTELYHHILSLLDSINPRYLLDSDWEKVELLSSFLERKLQKLESEHDLTKGIFEMELDVCSLRI